MTTQKKEKTKTSFLPLTLLLVLSMILSGLVLAQVSDASSHREAPMIAGDPKVDATDLYAFKSPDNADKVVLIANYLPFQEPAGGPNFYSFDDNARYEINIDNDGDAIPDVIYRFDFDSSYQNDETFLYATGPVTSLTDPDLNFRQTYTLTKVTDGSEEVLASDVPVPPSKIGPKTLPENSSDYLALQAAAVKNLPGGGTVFAGQNEDPFFVDLGATFDLLNIRKLPGNDGGGIDTLAGYNVQSLVLEVPMSEVTSDGSTPQSATSSNAVVGIWTTSSRQSTTVLNTDGSADYSGAWVQVSRLGQPLVNEVVIPVGLKDRFNASKPSDDTQFANLVANPEFPQVLNALFGIAVPPQGDFGTADARDDLIAIFLTGVEGLNQPEGVTPSEQLRLNLAIPVTENPHRLGVIAGDNQGFPNGRRLGDDVVDVALRVMAGAAYPLFHPEYTPDPTGLQLGDGVDSNDKMFRSSFPYVAAPYGGYASIPHANAQTGPQDDMDEGDMDMGDDGNDEGEDGENGEDGNDGDEGADGEDGNDGNDGEDYPSTHTSILQRIIEAHKERLDTFTGSNRASERLTALIERLESRIK